MILSFCQTHHLRISDFYSIFNTITSTPNPHYKLLYKYELMLTPRQPVSLLQSPPTHYPNKIDIKCNNYLHFTTLALNLGKRKMYKNNLKALKYIPAIQSNIHYLLFSHWVLVHVIDLYSCYNRNSFDMFFFTVLFLHYSVQLWVQ